MENHQIFHVIMMVFINILQVKVETVKVNWLFCGCDNTTPMPSREVTGAQLDRYGHNSYCTVLAATPKC